MVSKFQFYFLIMTFIYYYYKYIKYIEFFYIILYYILYIKLIKINLFQVKFKFHFFNSYQLLYYLIMQIININSKI